MIVARETSGYFGVVLWREDAAAPWNKHRVTHADYAALQKGGAPPVDPKYTGAPAAWEALWRKGPAFMLAALRRNYDTPSGDLEPDCVLLDPEGPGSLLVVDDDIDIGRFVILLPGEWSGTPERLTARKDWLNVVNGVRRGA